jgi:hypothetical protein
METLKNNQTQLNIPNKNLNPKLVEQNGESWK